MKLNGQKQQQFILIFLREGGLVLRQLKWQYCTKCTNISDLCLKPGVMQTRLIPRELMVGGTWQIFTCTPIRRLIVQLIIELQKRIRKVILTANQAYSFRFHFLTK